MVFEKATEGPRRNRNGTPKEGTKRGRKSTEGGIERDRIGPMSKCQNAMKGKSTPAP